MKRNCFNHGKRPYFQPNSPRHSAVRRQSQSYHSPTPPVFQRPRPNPSAPSAERGTGWGCWNRGRWSICRTDLSGRREGNCSSEGHPLTTQSRRERLFRLNLKYFLLKMRLYTTWKRKIFKAWFEARHSTGRTTKLQYIISLLQK